jgi:membrane protein implicated in regulation of membrane protease activity
LGARRFSDFTAAQQEQVLPLLAEMLEVLSVPFSLLFSYVIHAMIRAASSAPPHLSLWWATAMFLFASLAVTLYYFRRIDAIESQTRGAPVAG